MDRNTHLTSLEVALFAEKMSGTGQAAQVVLDDLTIHLEECGSCRMEVMECCDAIPQISRILDRESGLHMFLRDPSARKGFWDSLAGWIKKLFQESVPT